jgi:predicted nucleotidyltransferase
MLHPDIHARLDDIRRILADHRVKTAYVFGSALRENFKDDSDLDLLIEFEKGITTKDYADLYWDLGDKIEKLTGREVDLVTLSSITNKYFLMELENTREAIL